MSKGGGKRSRLSPKAVLAVWVRSGGRCMLCNAYLLEGAMSGRTLPLGEVAHIVEQSTDPRSPRGGDPLERALRDDADNLLLLCAQQHMEIDAKAALDVFTVEWLRGVKQEHEDRVRHLTALGPERATTVVRMVGSVHGNVVELSRETAANAVTAVGDAGVRTRRWCGGRPRTLLQRSVPREVGDTRWPGPARGGPSEHVVAALRDYRWLGIDPGFSARRCRSHRAIGAACGAQAVQALRTTV